MVTYLVLNHWHWWGLAALLIVGELLAPCVYFIAWSLAAAVIGLLVRFLPGMPGLWLPPEGTMNFADVGSAIRTFENRTDETGFPPRVWVDMEINQVINLADVQSVLSAFQGTAYAEIQLELIGVDPADCP